ncbi:MAG: FAD:protein FMN transferase, partial [Clostridia bacterium]|nr:FAD:protein FMN transferase [Clostridia bacterium]
NRASVGEKIEVGTHTQRLFALCLQYYGYTEGCFHPAMYAASTLWGFSADAQSYRVPTPEAQQAVKPLCDFSAFTLEGNMLSKSISGAMLDFGGIAKGYAVDCLKEIAESYGVTQGIIDLGGNLYLIGDKNGEPYTVAVTDPRPLGGTRVFFALTRLSDTSAVTSGDYENYFEEEGVRYSHIFDPKTCAPVRTDLVSVTVVDTCSARADILSTALFVMGYERAVAFAEENALSVVLVTAERRYYTKGVSVFDVDGGYQPI